MKKKLFVFLFLITLKITAQTTLKQFEINSKFIGETRNIKVSLPNQYENSIKRYPIVLILDDALLFETTNAIVNQLSNTTRMPESIVISISSREKHRNYFAPNLYNNNRDRSYNYGNHQEEFLQFLELELLPKIKKSYRINDFRTLIGFSPSSAFTLYTLMEKPDLFQAYICFAAGNIIGDGKQKGNRLIEDLEKFYAKNEIKQNYLYVVSGSLDADKQPYIDVNVRDFNKKLSKYNSEFVQTKAEILGGEGHTDVILMGLISAFNFIYPKEKWNVDYLELIKKKGTAKENITSFYKDLSNSYGFEIYPNVDRLYSMSCLKNVGRRLLSENRQNEAVELFEYWVKLYPNSHAAHFYLGIAQKETKNPSKALKSVKKAIALASKQNSNEAKKYKEALEKF
ncbi:alpha/beta hydrolase [Aureivirga marina]|uniref:alpha/beta hydrolase n=1 Tax=Aureivirga marina TaxID=1182451 RepID=UPI0018CBD9EF|nr:alpha/beta hydrolase-fold protein [Aureivirga marina]